jgi:hypothetical protein
MALAYRYELHECPAQYGYTVFVEGDDEPIASDCGFDSRERAEEEAKLEAANHRARDDDYYELTNLGREVLTQKGK